MKTRVLIAAAIAGGLALAPSSQAAAKPQVVDGKGDANAINGQGFDVPVPSQATPVQAASMDIHSIQFATDKKGKLAKNLVVTMTMGADVAANELKGGTFRTTASLGGCSISFALQQDPALGNLFYGRGCSDDPTAVLSDLPLNGKIKGKTIVFTANLKAYGLKFGGTLESLGGHTRANLVAVTAPVMDDAISATKYKIGS
jgi:hypothetical protein